MPRVIEPEKWVRYQTLRDQGHSVTASARRAGFSASAAFRFESGFEKSTGMKVKAVTDSMSLPKVKTYDKLSAPAKRGLEDFEFFRRRCFGHLSTPWQIDAASQMIELLATPEREYVVVNVSPGSGKSTLFTHDLLAWMAVRDRNIRVMIGSITESTVRDYTRRLRNTFERTDPDTATSTQIARNEKVDAHATLTGDYGRFKPERQDRWQERSFVIATERDIAGSNKEVSFAGFGADSKFIGGRYDVIVWDDLEDLKTIPTADQREQKERWFENIAESRLEPGGLLILQGQRLHAEDIYRWALNQKTLLFDEDNEILEDQSAAPMRYKHITYRAHYEDKCFEGSHRLDAPAWPDGCLLDPLRLSYRFLAPKKAQSPETFAVVYQQEDSNPASALVRKEWIDGGRDSNGEYHPGCKDTERGLLQIPDGLLGKHLRIVTVDPSAAKYWSIQDWLYGQQTKFRTLLNLLNQIMDAPDLLGYNLQTHTFYGVLEEWWQISRDQGRPIDYVIVEEAAAQRYLLQYDHVKEWQRLRRVRIIGHQCVDPETEVLSQRGWLRYDDVHIGDIILTLNTISEKAEWQPVQDVYRGHHTGPMHRFDHRNIDALCTLDHKWPRSNQEHAPLAMVESQHLNTASVLPLARPLAAEQDPEAWHTDDFVELVGWAVTEGHFDPKCQRIRIAQSPNANPEHVERIRTLLKRMGAEFYEGHNSVYDQGAPVLLFNVTGELARQVRAVTDNGKHLPLPFVWSLPRSQRQLLLHVMTISDGWTSPSGTRNFCSNDTSLATAFEVLCALEGRPTYWTVRPVDGEGGRDGRKADHYVVREKQASDSYLQNVGARPAVVDYDGIVWCPSTVNGTFYARRGGKTYFTGNTNRNKSDAKYGVQMVGPVWRDGLVRLPWGDDAGRHASMKLMHEVTRWTPTASIRDDNLMAEWFLEWQLGTNALFKPVSETTPRRNVPRWLGQSA